QHRALPADASRQHRPHRAAVSHFRPAIPSHHAGRLPARYRPSACCRLPGFGAHLAGAPAPPGAGLWWLIPLWAAMAALAVGACRRPVRGPGLGGGAAPVLAWPGGPFAGFPPPPFSAGISPPRHMVGTTLATALALLISLARAVSLISHALAGEPKTA